MQAVLFIAVCFPKSQKFTPLHFCYFAILLFCYFAIFI